MGSWGGHPWKFRPGFHPWTPRGQHAVVGKGWRSKEAPQVKEIAKIGNGVHLQDARWRQSILEGASHDLQTMDDLIFRLGRRDGAVGMAKFYRVRDDLALGVAPHKFEAAV